MYNRCKIDAKQITYILIFLLPIMPWYFEIFGLNGINFFCAFYIFIIVCFFTKKVYKPAINQNKLILFAVITWFFTKSITFLSYGNLVEIIFFFIRTVALYFVFSLVIRDKDSFLNVIKWILIASFFVCISGLIEEATRFNIFSILKYPGYRLNYNPLRFGILRILGFAEHTIVYGIYLMFCMSLCVYYVQYITQNKKIFYMILYILLWINMFLTLSRSSIIAASILQIIIFYFKWGKKFIIRMFKITILAIILIIIASITISKVSEMLNNIYYMVIAVLNSDYNRRIISSFGGDNLNAKGDRINLYKWVIEKMPGGWTFGHGKDALFIYSYPMTNGVWTWTVNKQNIEVQYLDIMYRYGIIGLISEILVYIAVLLKSVTNKYAYWEKKLNFNKVAFFTLLIYYLELFAVNQTSDRSIFYIFSFLVIIYNTRLVKAKENI